MNNILIIISNKIFISIDFVESWLINHINFSRVNLDFRIVNDFINIFISNILRFSWLNLNRGLSLRLRRFLILLNFIWSLFKVILFEVLSIFVDEIQSWSLLIHDIILTVKFSIISFILLEFNWGFGINFLTNQKYCAFRWI